MFYDSEFDKCTRSIRFNSILAPVQIYEIHG
jgi:hypothetical protein